jgi:hypothetical protein
MRQGQGRGISEAEKTELWDRWQRGEPLKAIGRAFGNAISNDKRGVRAILSCTLGYGT